MKKGTNLPDAGTLDGLDVASVSRWLMDRSIVNGVVEARVLSGGRSNLTYTLLDTDGLELVLRRPPMGGPTGRAHDVEREHRILLALTATEVPVADPVAFCDDESVTGAPFSVVSKVDGLALRSPEDVARLHPTARNTVRSTFATCLAELHRVDATLAGIPLQKGERYVQRQLQALRSQFGEERDAATARLEDVASALARSVPEQRLTSIVHGDYRLDNVIVGRDGEVRAVLDWELWTLGDPHADLGTSVAYWTETPWEIFGLNDSPTANGLLGSREELVAAYLAAGGSPPNDDRLDWYTAFGVWRFAAILAGVHHRNLQGRYGSIGDDSAHRYAYVVPALADIAAQLLRRRR